MNIILPYRITRKFIQSHPQYNFIYGCDCFNKSFFGCAYSAHGELNAYGVPTLWKCCPSGMKYFDDDNPPFFDLVKQAIDEIPLDQGLIIIFPKIGMGFSEENKRAPQLYNYMMQRLDAIRYHDITIDYHGETYPLYPSS